MKHIPAVLLSLILCFFLLSMTVTADENSASEQETASADNSGTSASEPETTTTFNPSRANAVFIIDNQNIYEGMDESWQNGYTPQVADTTASVILPLTSSRPLKDNKLTAALDLGERIDNPFIYKNYRKTFTLSSQKINHTDEIEEIYYVRFDLPLSEARINGVYPVIISVTAEDAENREVNGKFTVYVTIKDGKEPANSTDESDQSGNGPEVSDDEPGISDEKTGFSGDISGTSDDNSNSQADKPSSQPAILVSGSICKPEVPEAGKHFQVTVHLTNTSKKKSVQNMVITVSCDSPELTLLNESNTIYVEKLGKDASTDIVLKYQTGKNITEGKYTINLSLSYDNEDAEPLSSSGSIIVPVKQPLSVKMNMPSVASSVTAGDTISLNFQLMNLGRSKIYNVRCEVNGQGLLPMNTAFVGDMEPGTSSEASMNVFIGTLQQGSSKNEAQEEPGGQKDQETQDGQKEEKEQTDAYGPTTGTVTLIYEDADGNEYMDTSAFCTRIEQPVIISSNTDADSPQKAGQWWISILIGGILLLSGGIGLYLTKLKNRKLFS